MAIENNELTVNEPERSARSQIQSLDMIKSYGGLIRLNYLVHPMLHEVDGTQLYCGALVPMVHNVV